MSAPGGSHVLVAGALRAFASAFSGHIEHILQMLLVRLPRVLYVRLLEVLIVCLIQVYFVLLFQMLLLSLFHLFHALAPVVSRAYPQGVSCSFVPGISRAIGSGGSRKFIPG